MSACAPVNMAQRLIVFSTVIEKSHCVGEIIMKSIVFKLITVTVVCAAFAVSAQIPTVRVTTQNNQEPTTTTTMTSTCPNGQPPNGMFCTGGGFPTMTQTVHKNYVAMTRFEMTVPGNPSHNVIRELQTGGQPDSIRVRGNSTATQNKRPYRIKFDNRQSLFGNEAARSWVFIANFYDYTLMLNAIAFELGRRLNLEFTPSYQFVDVHINGSYKGIYLLTEQMQVNRGRVDIDRHNGWLVEFDYHAAEGDQIIFDTDGGNISMPCRIRDPEVDSDFTVNNPTLRFVVREVNALFNAMAANGFPENGYRDLIDLESWAKYVLIQQLMDNFDFNNKAGMGMYGQPGSNYAYKDFGKRIHAGPLWDFDLSAGVVDPGMDFANWPKHYVTHQEALRPRHPFYQRLWEDPVFLAKFKKLWDRHQADFNAMPRVMDSIANVLSNRVQANFAAYSGGPPEFAPRPTNEQTYKVHVDSLKNWWGRRTQFFGQQLNAMNIDTTRDINQNTASLLMGEARRTANGKNITAVKNGFNLNSANGTVVKIFSLDGREVRRIKLTAGNHSVRLSGLPKGMYMAKIVIDGNKQVLKVPVK